MIQMHPILALEVFIGEDVDVSPQLRNAMKGGFDKKTSPFSTVDIQSTLDWCDKKPKYSYPKLASIITPHHTIDKCMEWTPLALKLLNKAPDPIEVLDQYSSNLPPTMWSGSLAQILESQLPLFDILISHSNRKVSTWAIDKKAQWQDSIVSNLTRESTQEKETSERFEW